MLPFPVIKYLDIFKAKKKLPTDLIPAEDMRLLPPDSDMAGNTVTGTWEYRNAQNEVAFYVLRTEPELGKKETKPCRLSEGQWVWSYPEGKLPLYNGHLVNDGSVILFGEGEKTAAHLHGLGVGIGMTSAGGSSRLMGSDLSPLKKASKVIIFPDADDPGVKYASQVMWYCKAHDIECQLLNTDALGWTNGEDAADHPELLWSDYIPYLISTEDWQIAHPEASDNGLFEVVGNLSEAEYDRAVERLAFGVPKNQIDHRRVRQAAQQAQLTESIQKWPDKYQTYVGERGVRLSGGQRQRIGIARALYKQADVIIFDEATSALDNETEQAVMQSIESLSKDLTILIIAHRLTTIKNCTQIIELGEGVIKKIGNFEQVVSLKNK